MEASPFVRQAASQFREAVTEVLAALDRAEAEWPEDCLLSRCTFTPDGSCTVHYDENCPDCYCGSPLHWEPK